MRKRPRPRPLIDPPVPREVVLSAAHRLVPALGLPPGVRASAWREQALQAAAYAIAAFDPRDAVETMLVIDILAIAYCVARTRQDGIPRPQHQQRIAVMLRGLQRRQGRPPFYAAPSVPDAPESDIALTSRLDVRAWGYTPWQELIRDPGLRRRLARAG